MTSVLAEKATAAQVVLSAFAGMAKAPALTVPIAIAMAETDFNIFNP